MKIVLLANSFLPTHGGREIVIHHLAKSLQELGHNVRVVLIGGARSRRHLQFPYQVNIYPGFGKYLKLKIRAIFYYYDIKKFGADIISAHATFPAGYSAVKLKKHLGVPVVITPHGNDIHMLPEINHGLRLNPEFKEKIEYAVMHADLVTSISGSIEDSLLSAGCKNNNIRSVPNGIDIDRFTRKQDLNIRQWLKVPAKTRLVLSVGKYQERKGHEYIVKAMPAIVEQHPDVKLVIAGGDTEALKPLINDLNMGENVILTGLIKFPVMGNGGNDYLAAIYQASSIYISGSVGEGAEGLSLAVLDGMAAGCPIVATDISGNRDIVQNGVNGFLVKPQSETAIANSCNEILSNADLSLKMEQASRNKASDFSWKSVAEKYLAVFDEAIAQQHS